MSWEGRKERETKHLTVLERFWNGSGTEKKNIQRSLKKTQFFEKFSTSLDDCQRQKLSHSI